MSCILFFRHWLCLLPQLHSIVFILLKFWTNGSFIDVKFFKNWFYVCENFMICYWELWVWISVQFQFIWQELSCSLKYLIFKRHAIFFWSNWIALRVQTEWVSSLAMCQHISAILLSFRECLHYHQETTWICAGKESVLCHSLWDLLLVKESQQRVWKQKLVALFWVTVLIG